MAVVVVRVVVECANASTDRGISVWPRHRIDRALTFRPQATLCFATSYPRSEVNRSAKLVPRLPVARVARGPSHPQRASRIKAARSLPAQAGRNARRLSGRSARAGACAMTHRVKRKSGPRSSHRSIRGIGLAPRGGSLTTTL